MLVYYFQVVLEVTIQFLYIMEDLPQVLLNLCHYAGEFHIAHARDQIVGHGVVLVAEKEREFRFEVGHKRSRFALPIAVLI